MRRLAIALVPLLSLMIGACSDDSSTDSGVDMQPDTVDAAVCALQITRINGVPIANVTGLDATFDSDPATSGLQVDVTVEGAMLVDGTSVGLNVTGLAPDPMATAGAGSATFRNVTIGSSLTSVLFRAFTGGCNSDSLLLDVTPAPECFFERPKHGATLGLNDDKNPDNGTFDFDVVIDTVNAQGGTVEFEIDGLGVGQGQPASDGRILFPDVQLPVNPQVVLTARAIAGGFTSTCTATIAVNSDLPECTLQLMPQPITTLSGGNGLGIAQDSNSGTPGIENDLVVATGTDVDEVTIFINGAPAQTVAASGGSATFQGLAIPDGVQTIQATCVDVESGNSSQSPSVNIEVDSVKPPPASDFSCAVENSRNGQIRCLWTAVGPGVSRYEVRYAADQVLDDSNWLAATLLAQPLAFIPGVQHSEQVIQLPLGSNYQFGVRSVDNVLNESDLSASAALNVDFKRQERSHPSGNFTFNVVSGNFNCDEHTDLAIADPNEDGTKGKVYVYFGTPNGFFSTFPDTVLSGTAIGGFFGTSIAALRDFNGDDCADLAVLAPGSGAEATGRVYVYLGASGFFNRTDEGQTLGADRIYELPSQAPTIVDSLQKVASTGDFVGNSLSDLVIRVGTGVDRKLLVIAGDSTLGYLGAGPPPAVLLTGATLAAEITGGTKANNFGDAICGGLSLNGDGLAELIVGEPLGAANMGRVYVVSGQVPVGTDTIDISAANPRTVSIDGITAGGEFGRTVAAVGDMDGAGGVEFAVGAPLSGSGVVHVFNLTSTPSTANDHLFQVTNDTSDAKFGTALACAGGLLAGGDLNKDGFADLVVGAEGASGAGVRVFYGNGALVDTTASQAGLTFLPGSSSVGFGQSVVWVEDVNNDSFVDLLMVDPGFTPMGQFVLHY